MSTNFEKRIEVRQIKDPMTPVAGDRLLRSSPKLLIALSKSHADLPVDVVTMLLRSHTRNGVVMLSRLATISVVESSIVMNCRTSASSSPLRE